MSIRVEAPGLQTTLQQLRRPGLSQSGPGPDGVMDEVSHRLVSLLVGNPPETPSMEITRTGPVLEFETEVMIALGGADLSAEIDGLPVPLWRPVMVRAGAQMRFGKPLEGSFCYLAVAGGFSSPASASVNTDLAAEFEGLQDRALRAGDRLGTEPPPPGRYPQLQRCFQREDRAIVGLGWSVPWYQELDFRRPATLRVIPGPNWPVLTAEAKASLLGETFRVASDSDRQGLHLRGPKLALEHPLQPPMSAAAGTLQMPEDGHPILLLADRNGTARHPGLAELASVDLPKAAHLRPGDPLRWQSITPEQARQLQDQRDLRFQELAAQVSDRMLR